MTRKRLFDELSKSISVRVPESKAVWMRPHIKEYIKYLAGHGKTYIQLLGLSRDKDGQIDLLKKQIKDIEEARAIKVELPDSWVIKDSEDD